MFATFSKCELTTWLPAVKMSEIFRYLPIVSDGEMTILRCLRKVGLNVPRAGTNQFQSTSGRDSSRWRPLRECTNERCLRGRIDRAYQSKAGLAPCRVARQR